MRDVSHNNNGLVKSSVLIADRFSEIQKEGGLITNILGVIPLHIQCYSKELREIIDNNDRFTKERVEDLNQRKEHSLFREVNKIQWIVRAGPRLGLMGTFLRLNSGCFCVCFNS